MTILIDYNMMLSKNFDFLIKILQNILEGLSLYDYIYIKFYNKIQSSDIIGFSYIRGSISN